MPDQGAARQAASASAAGRVAQPPRRAGRQAAGREHALPRQPQFDPRHPRQQLAVGGLQAALEADRDRRRPVARQLQRREAAVEGDDQVAVLGALAVGQPGAEAAEQRQRRQCAERPREAAPGARLGLTRTWRT